VLCDAGCSSCCSAVMLTSGTVSGLVYWIASVTAWFMPTSLLFIAPPSPGPIIGTLLPLLCSARIPCGRILSCFMSVRLRWGVSTRG